MKKILLLLILILNFTSCDKRESEKTSSASITSRSTYINGTISGNMNPIIGIVYTYKLSFSKLSNVAGIKVSSATGGVFFRDPDLPDRFTNVLDVYVGENGKTEFSFDVLWTQESTSGSLIITPSSGSVIQINASLSKINVKMNPIKINVPDKIELGSTITFWGNCPLNKNSSRINWSYDQNIFSEISQSASESLGKFQIDLKCIQSCKQTNVKVEISRPLPFDFNSPEGPIPVYYVFRKGSIDLYKIGPQIIADYEGQLAQYSIHGFKLDVSSNLSNIEWEDNAYIKCIGNRHQYSAEFNPVKAGKSVLAVTYNYKNSKERFRSTIPIEIYETPLTIAGNKDICYHSSGIYSIDNLPPKATIFWNSSLGTEPLSSTERTFTCKNVDKKIEEIQLYATITLPSGYSFKISKPIDLFNSADQSFDKGIIKDTQLYKAADSPFAINLEINAPSWAKNFFWSVKNAGKIMIQEREPYSDVFLGNNDPKVNSIIVTVDYESPCGDKYSVTQDIPIIRKQHKKGE